LEKLIRIINEILIIYFYVIEIKPLT